MVEGTQITEAELNVAVVEEPKKKKKKKIKRAKDPKPTEDAEPADPADTAKEPSKKALKKRKRAKEPATSAQPASEGAEGEAKPKRGLADPQGSFDELVAQDGAVDMEVYHGLIKHCARTSDMSAAVYLWHKMSDAGLEHGSDEYKLLHPLHGKKMEDSKALQKVPDLPTHVKSTKREIHEILTNQQLGDKKERATDKLPIVISELLKIEDHGWARVFDSSSALAQFLARRCKMKESQTRPLVSILRDGELFTMLGATKEGKPKPGEPVNKKVRIASREKLIACAKALSSAAKEVAKDEDVDDEKRRAAKETARLLRIEICQATAQQLSRLLQGVQVVKDQKKKELKGEEKPWEAVKRKAGDQQDEEEEMAPANYSDDEDDDEPTHKVAKKSKKHVEAEEEPKKKKKKAADKHQVVEEIKGKKKKKSSAPVGDGGDYDPDRTEGQNAAALAAFDAL